MSFIGFYFLTHTTLTKSVLQLQQIEIFSGTQVVDSQYTYLLLLLTIDRQLVKRK